MAEATPAAAAAPATPPAVVASATPGAAPPAAAAPEAPKTVLDAGRADGTTPEPIKGAWPSDWRELYAKGADGKVDDKKMQRLSRYAAPTAALDAMLAAQDKIRSGEFKSTAPFPETGTDADKAAWRRDQGLPEAPDKYDLKLADGLAIGEDDRPIVNEFLKEAHAANLPPAAVNTAVNWFFKEQVRQAEAQEVADENYRKSSEDALRVDWGGDYRRNVGAINGFLDTAPKGIKESFLGGRLADGSAVASNPQMLKWLAGLALQINPISTLVPGAGANQAGAVDDRINEIEKVMRTDRKTYNRDDKMQTEYRELLSARDKLKSAA